MSKTLLVCCGGMPHSIEYMEPALTEAKWRGYHIVGAYGDKEVVEAMKLTGLFDSYEHYEGFWEPGYMVLRIPKVDEIFKKVKPDTILVDYCGGGLSGGVWLEEAYKRHITVVELNGCNCDVQVFNEKTRDVTAKFLDSLKAAGYGKDHSHTTVDTEVVQWVGLVNGDQLLREFDPEPIKVKLGLKPDQRLVTVMGTWSVGGYQDVCNEDLKEWAELARQNNARLCLSPHPVMRYTPGLQKIIIPKDVIISSSFPGKFWNYSFILLKSADLIRASDVVLYQHLNGIMRFTVAAHVPMWLRRADMARGASRSREAMLSEDELENYGIERTLAWSGGPGYESLHFDNKLVASICYRTQPQLEALFAGGLGFKEDKWESLNEHLKLRLDGRVAERIVDLLET